jgi:Cytidylate kinase
MPLITTSTVDKSINDLAQTIWNHHKTIPPSKRTLVSISGIPGSGKSTLARHLAERLNSLFLETTILFQRREHQPTQTSPTHLPTPSPSTSPWTVTTFPKPNFVRYLIPRRQFIAEVQHSRTMPLDTVDSSSNSPNQLIMRQTRSTRQRLIMLRKTLWRIASRLVRRPGS